jgi:hypothetical protein
MQNNLAEKEDIVKCLQKKMTEEWRQRRPSTSTTCREPAQRKKSE